MPLPMEDNYMVTLVVENPAYVPTQSGWIPSSCFASVGPLTLKIRADRILSAECEVALPVPVEYVVVQLVIAEPTEADDPQQKEEP